MYVCDDLYVCTRNFKNSTRKIKSDLNILKKILKEKITRIAGIKSHNPLFFYSLSNFLYVCL